MDVATLRTQLKNAHPAPLYLVLGTQQVLLDQARAAFLALVPETERVMNVGSYDLEETDLATALDDAQSAPFFGERRLVLLNKPAFLTGNGSRGKVKQDPELLLNYLKAPQPSTLLVILAPYEKLDGRKAVVKALKKQAVQVSAAPLSEQDARRLIQARVQQAGFHFGSGALDELVRRTNADYGLMMAHLPQLQLLAYQSKEIDSASVQGLVAQSLDENVFDLVTAVLQRHQEQALGLYRELLAAQQQPLQINAVLVSQFRLLLQVKILTARGLSQATLAKQLKVHPYRVKLAAQTVRRFTLPALSQAYLGLVRIEKALKTTNRTPELLFQLFLLQYSQKVS